MKNWGSGGVLQGKYMHMRCMTHIINLMVEDELKEKEAEQAVNKIRIAVRYVKKSPQRLAKFEECVERAKIQSKTLLRLDVSTRWNSTYLMLDTAEKFEKAFEYYVECEPSLEKELRDEAGGVLYHEDWSNARRLNIFLCKFSELIKRISGSLYNTSNTLFAKITQVAEWLQKWCKSDDIIFVSMVTRMKEKYAKYWGDMDQMNMLINIECILDPRRKLEYVEFVINESYRADRDKAKNMCKCVNESLHELFAWYQQNSTQNDHSDVSTNVSSLRRASSPENLIDLEAYSWLSEIDKIFLLMEGGGQSMSELAKYLAEEREPMVKDDLDILNWWKISSVRFPILSEMARDVLATVASELTCCTGERVIDDFKSSLNPDMVEILICSASWMMKQESSTPDEEDDEDDEAEEEPKDLPKESCKHSVADSDTILDLQEEEDTI